MGKLRLTPNELDFLSKMPRELRGNSDVAARLQRLNLICLDRDLPRWVLTEKGERFVNKKPAARVKSAPTCKGCGKPLKPFVDASVNPGADRARRPPEQTADGQPPTRGNYGDNAFCGIQCGWKFAVRALAAVDGVADLLCPGQTPAALAVAEKNRRKTRREQERAKLAAQQLAFNVTKENRSNLGE